MRNVWWEFLDDHNRRSEWECDSWWGWRGGEELNAEAQYRSPVFTDVPGPGCYLRFETTVTQDAGATAIIFGADNSGQPLQTQQGDGSWVQGIKLSATSPYAQSTVLVGRIDRVVLSATQSTKTLLAYNASTGAITQLAEYGPTETNPSFLRYRLAGGSGFWCNNKCPKSAILLVKLSKVTIQNPTDPVYINNRGALMDGIRASKLEDASQSGVAWWKSAVEKLNRQLENAEPDDQFSAQSNTFGDNRCMKNHVF